MSLATSRATLSPSDPVSVLELSPSPISSPASSAVEEVRGGVSFTMYVEMKMELKFLYRQTWLGYHRLCLASSDAFAATEASSVYC